MEQAMGHKIQRARAFDEGMRGVCCKSCCCPIRHVLAVTWKLHAFDEKFFFIGVAHEMIQNYTCAHASAFLCFHRQVSFVPVLGILVIRGIECTVEPAIPGTFRKFNTNTQGFVDHKHIAQVTTILSV